MILLGTFLMLFLSSANAQELSPYPRDCYCHKGGAACHPVPCGEIHRYQERGYTSGFHWKHVFFPDEMIRQSMDGACHVCVDDVYSIGDQERPYCIFFPLVSS